MSIYMHALMASLCTFIVYMVTIYTDIHVRDRNGDNPALEMEGIMMACMGKIHSPATQSVLVDG